MWLYNGGEFVFTEELAQTHVGFVYLITNTTNYRQYIGKKLFTMAKTKQVKGKRKKFRSPSNWQEYYGSNTNLQEDVKRLGPEAFTREILHLCKTKGQCSYWEAKEQLTRDVLLFPDLWYNQQVRCRIHRSHLKLES